MGETGAGEVDGVGGGTVESVLEEADKGDVTHGADVVFRARAGAWERKVDIRRVQGGGVGPGFKDGLIEDAVLDGCVEGLDTPVQRTLCGTRHHNAAYRARRVVAVVEKNASKG